MIASGFRSRVPVPTRQAGNHRLSCAPLRRVSLAAVPVSPPQPPTSQVDPWKKVVEAEKKGETVEVLVKSFNKGGLLVSMGELRGFVPYNQLAAATQKKGQLMDYSFLLGQKLRAKVVNVDMQGPKREVVFSEKKAAQSDALRQLQVGQVLRGKISGIEEYGAFVDLIDFPGLSGLMHKSEISWDRLIRVDDAVQKGQLVTVKVTEVDANKCKLRLSIRQLTPDPLKQTIDTLQWGPTSSVPVEIQRLVDRLSAREGITSVMIMRQAQDTHHISQELQVFMTRAEMADGVMVVARLGTVVQELQLNTELPRESVKEILQAVVRSS